MYLNLPVPPTAGHPSCEKRGAFYGIAYKYRLFLILDSQNKRISIVALGNFSNFLFFRYSK
jgi:hypothetical protein